VRHNNCLIENHVQNWQFILLTIREILRYIQKGETFIDFYAPLLGATVGGVSTTAESTKC
jgi:hypothetical protein